MIGALMLRARFERNPCDEEGLNVLQKHNVIFPYIGFYLCSSKSTRAKALLIIALYLYSDLPFPMCACY